MDTATTSAPTPPLVSPAEKAAGVLSVVGGLLHGVAAPAHFEAWWGYGLFFVFAASAQILFGLALLTKAINPKDFGAGWERAKQGLLWAGVLGNLAILALYLVTRTSGIPYGPEAGLVEGVGLLDVASKLVELAVVSLLVAVLFRSAKPKVAS